MKRLFVKKLELSPLWTLLLWLVLSCFILVLCVALQPGPVLKTLQNFLQHPKLLILNLFPVLVRWASWRLCSGISSGPAPRPPWSSPCSLWSI